MLFTTEHKLFKIESFQSFVMKFLPMVMTLKYSSFYARNLATILRFHILCLLISMLESGIKGNKFYSSFELLPIYLSWMETNGFKSAFIWKRWISVNTKKQLTRQLSFFRNDLKLEMLHYKVLILSVKLSRRTVFLIWDRWKKKLAMLQALTAECYVISAVLNVWKQTHFTTTYKQILYLWTIYHKITLCRFDFKDVDW